MPIGGYVRSGLAVSQARRMLGDVACLPRNSKVGQEMMAPNAECEAEESREGFCLVAGNNDAALGLGS
jgi:hypothetical protein